MAFEYYIEQMDCTIQQKRTPEEFVQRIKGYNLYPKLESSREAIETNGRDFESIKMKIAFPVKTILGTKSEMSVPELREYHEFLDHKTRPLCRECRANQNPGGVFGCYGSIRYPISQEAETWLMGQFDPGTSSYLAYHANMAECKGHEFDQRRGPVDDQANGLLLECQTPIVGRSEHEEEITLSQLLEYLIACQKLMPETCMALCREFGAVEIDEGAMIMMNMMSMGGQAPDGMMDDIRNSPMKYQTFPGEDRSIAEIKKFLATCWKAYLLGTRVVVDG